MSFGDFLRKEAQTPLIEHYVVGGVLCAISTNFESILDAARDSFCLVKVPWSEPRMHLRFWVDPKGTTQPPWPKPYFRGLGHLIFAGFDTQSSILIDLRSRRALGRFSPAMGSDRLYWKTVILPVLISIMGASVGVTELHCACVAKNGSGLLLAGRSGSGKSTLAVALAQAGFGYVSDDRTYCSEWDGRLVVWGLPTQLKLRPAAARWFRELRVLDPVTAPNGERAFQIDPDRWAGIERVQRCDPRWLVFLEQREGPSFDLAPMSSTEAADRLEEDLVAEAGEAAEVQREMIATLGKLPCWRLRYGGRPQSVAEELARHFGEGRQRPFPPAYPEERTVRKSPEVKIERQDPLRRFTPTPYIADLPLMGRKVRLETNCTAIFERTLRVFARYRGTPGGDPDFLWRIISESRVQMKPPWPEKAAFSDEGLRFINFGQRSFVAVDLEAREGIGFLAEGLAEDEPGFCGLFLGDLFYLTAGMLGLVPMSMACVAFGEKGILVLGSPNNGKTTSGYLAARLGLEFHADRAVFLDLGEGRLRVWGDFLPAAFRVETSEFLPELQIVGRPFHYRDLTFLYVEKSPTLCFNAHPVVPVSCVFLERGVANVPRLTPLNHVELSRLLRESLPFRDDERFKAQESAALSALAQVPAYHLAYGNDPAEATRFFRSLLVSRDLLEANRRTAGLHGGKQANRHLGAGPASPDTRCHQKPRASGPLGSCR